jgi:SAM-dependent methyltransferase
MSSRMVHMRRILGVLCFTALTAVAAVAEGPQAPYEPTVGQAGRDVIWVPTPYPLVEKMLGLARVTPRDFVIDLGSGDGRNVIAAARRGVRSLGVEYNPDMVELSKRSAEKAGLGARAVRSRPHVRSGHLAGDRARAVPASR